MKRILLWGLAALALVSCQNKEMDSVDEATFVPNGYEVFYAETESGDSAETKVYADQNLKVLWEAEDRITIFNQYSYNRAYTFQGETGDNSGSFRAEPVEDFVTGNPLPYIYAVYPYQESNRITNQSVLQLEMPAVQSYAENSFGRGANVMVSVTNDNYLLFRNVGGYLGVKLYGEGVAVSKVSLRGNAGEKLAGAATVTMPVGGVPEVTMGEDADTAVTIVSEEPVKLGASAEEYTEFWFVLPPTEFAEGLTITVAGPGGVFEKSTSQPISITRSNISRLAPVEVELVAQGQPSNEIWYTSLDGEVIELTVESSETFGANLVSNEYVDGVGILSFDGPVTQIGYGAFAWTQWRKNLKTISIPEGVSLIGDSVFANCSNLISATLPDSVTEFGVGIFRSCPYLEFIGSRFASADGRCLIVDGTLNSFAPFGLESYSIPEGVVTIGREVFQSSTVSYIELPESLRTIEEYAFYGSNLASIVLPEGLESIGYRAFDSTYLTTVHIPSTVENLADGAFMYCSYLESFTGRYASEDGLCLIANGMLAAFAPKGLTGTEYVVPEGVTLITRRIFRYLPLTSLVLPTTLKEMSYRACEYCESLESVTFLSTTPMGSDIAECFRNCGEFQIYVPFESIDDYKAVWTDWADRILPIPSDAPITFVDADLEADLVTAFDTDGDGALSTGEAAAVTSFDGVFTKTSYTSFDEFRYFTSVTDLPADSFKTWQSLERISFPHSLKSIGAYSFVDCTSLKEIVLNNGLQSVGSFAFCGCRSLEKLYIPESLTDLGGAAFTTCQRLESISGPNAGADGRTWIKDNALLIIAPYGLKEFTIPNGVIRLGRSLFFNCIGLTKITVPDSVTEMETRVFAQSFLTEIEIPSVTNIPDFAFQYCEKLETVILSGPVASIGKEAFGQCPVLQSVELYVTTPPTLNGGILNGSDNCSIYVMPSAVEAYKSSASWSAYADRIFANPKISDHTSAITNARDLSSQQANCFVITVPGAYKFPAFKGSSEASVGNVFGAGIVWESCNNSEEVAENSVIVAVDYEDNWIYFQTPESLKPGNALICAQDSTGKILWSWHIWIPASRITTNTYGIWNKPLMDRNLGALVAAQAGEAAPVESFGLTYQWGRKDPFVGPAATSGNSNAAVAGQAPETAPGDGQGDVSKISLSYATEHPWILGFSQNGDWVDVSDDTFWQNGVKTIYDPCPAGYKVPDYDNDQPWMAYDMSTVEGWEENIKNGYFLLGNPVAVFPFAGYRDDYGPEGYTKQYLRVAMWTSYSREDRPDTAFGFDIRSADSGNKHLVTSRPKARGSYVRCVKL